MGNIYPDPMHGNAANNIPKIGGVINVVVEMTLNCNVIILPGGRLVFDPGAHFSANGHNILTNNPDSRIEFREDQDGFRIIECIGAPGMNWVPEDF